MPQKKCIPLTDDEMKYVNRVMEKVRKSRAKELSEMRDKKHRVFTARERREIDKEIKHLERTVETMDDISNKLYCIYSK